MQRRSFIHSTAALGLLGLAGCATPSVPAKAKVVVIGGGWGGATAAKYVRLLSDHKIDVVLIEPNSAFVSCPLSNLVLGGSRQLADMTVPYTGLTGRHGITLVQDTVTSIDPRGKTVTLARGSSIGYDKLILSPGIDIRLDGIQGLPEAYAAGKALHAWKAGAETVALRRQLEAMSDGGVYALALPGSPYRCPPGPYERACQVASYFKAAKPRSKVLILDANPEVTSKGPLFRKIWAENYRGIVEHREHHNLVAVDGRTGTLKFEVHPDVKADVINVIPPQRAGLIAVQTGLANQANGRWVGVNYRTFETTAAKDVHVVGDAIQLAPLMPKSGHMANNHGKVAAAAVVAELSGFEPNPRPMVANTCYSFVDDKNVIHVASVHEYADNTYKVVQGASGVSTGPTELEGVYANNWAKTIWADMLA